jgi:4-hydroxy-2-oxoheptanedioate aldolase
VPAAPASSSLKGKLLSKPPLLGGFVFSKDPNIPAIYAEAGFDFVVIDTEHALNDINSVEAHLRGCAAAGINAIIRLGVANFPDASRLLDAGAEGFMIPHLGRGADTRGLLDAMKYWPDGSRPTCTGVQMAGYGLRNFADCAERSNRDVLSIGLAEDRDCIDRLGGVLDDARVDWIMPGPADLASSFGVHGKLNHPLVRSAIDKVISEAQRKGVAVGIYVNDPSEIADWLARDIGFFVYSIDYKVLGKSLRAAAGSCREAFAGARAAVQA